MKRILLLFAACILVALCAWGLDQILRGFDVGDFHRGLAVGGVVSALYHVASDLRRWRAS